MYIYQHVYICTCAITCVEIYAVHATKTKSLVLLVIWKSGVNLLQKSSHYVIPINFYYFFFLAFSLVAYIGVSTALTLMVPYYKLEEYTSVATAFEQKGFKTGKYIVAVGATFGLFASLGGTMIPLPRILYSMASDRVIFAFLGRVNQRTETPVIACVISGLLTALLALLLDFISLVEMLSIGTLLAYTIVALCVLLLRYKSGSLGIEINNTDSTDEDGRDGKPDIGTNTVEVDQAIKSSTDKEDAFTEEANTVSLKNEVQPEYIKNDRKYCLKTGRLTSFYEKLIGCQVMEPTEETYNVVKIASAAFVSLSITLQSCLIYGLDTFTSGNPVMYALVVFLCLSMLFVVQVISCQPQSKNELLFKVPLVPLVPLLSMFANIYLILMLSVYTWIRFSVWMTLGKKKI